MTYRDLRLEVFQSRRLLLCVDVVPLIFSSKDCLTNIFCCPSSEASSNVSLHLMFGYLHGGGQLKHLHGGGQLKW